MHACKLTADMHLRGCPATSKKLDGIAEIEHTYKCVRWSDGGEWYIDTGSGSGGSAIFQHQEQHENRDEKY